MSAEKCPFQGGGGGTRDTFKEEEGGEYVPCDPRERQEYIWDKILQNRVYETGKEWPSLSDMINVDYSGVFETKGDVQEAKKKVLCSRGVTAKVRVEWFNHEKYTGLFKKADFGVIRLTSAILGSDSIPSWLGSVSESKIFPCCALKFFRGSAEQGTHGHSGNFLFGGKKTGQKEVDFFSHPVCTHLTEKISFMLSWILSFFRQYSSYPTQLGVSDFASVRENGFQEVDIIFPWCIALVPPAHSIGVERPVHPSNDDELPYVKQLLQIPSGTHLYDVYCIAAPSSLNSNSPDERPIERIGRVFTTSEFVLSSFDQQIFFKHQKKEEDYALRPDWLDDLTDVHANTGSSFFETNIRNGNYVDFEIK